MKYCELIQGELLCQDYDTRNGGNYRSFVPTEYSNEQL
jgi:hypothetical protein